MFIKNFDEENKVLKNNDEKNNYNSISENQLILSTTKNNNENNNKNNNENNNENNNNENNNNVINNENNNNVINNDINNINNNDNNLNNGNNNINNNNHANQINRNEEDKKTITIIKSKIKELKEKYNFCIQFYDIMTKILNNIQELTYEKIKNSTNESLNYFKFFKNSSELYTKFAEDMKLSNNIIMTYANLPKMNDNILLNAMKKTQDKLCKSLYDTSSILNKNIISKGPMANLNEKINKIEAIKKNNHSKFKEIEELKKKLIKNYKNYEKIFDIFCPDINNRQNNRRLPPLIDTPDFVYIIKQLINLINKLTLDINLYIIEIKDSLYTVNGIFVDINNLVRDSVLIYIKESKNIFNVDVTKNFEEIEKYYKKLEENKSDKMFKLKKIFNTGQSEQNFHTLLQQYYILLSCSNFTKKELLKDRNTFSIHKYDNILLFFEWLISISPQPTSLTMDELIIKKFKVKRDPGVFKSWKDSVMIFTKQYHLLIFDEPENENLSKIFELDKTSFRKKNDNKRRFLFELIVNRKGKLMNFTGNFLFDGLNNENINEIPPLIYAAYNP